MRKNSYTLIESMPTGEVAKLDFNWTIEKKLITDFSINVSVLGEEKSMDVYRVDTKHGYLHEHRLWQSTNPKRLDMGYNKAFTEKKKEVMKNYRRWVLLFRENRRELYEQNRKNVR